MMCFYNADHISYDGLSVSELIEKANADLGEFLICLSFSQDKYEDTEPEITFY